MGWLERIIKRMLSVKAACNDALLNDVSLQVLLIPAPECRAKAKD